MQPILVRPIEGGRFEIIAGERRWRAAKRAGLTEVPALVRPVPDQSALALALIENIQREDLNPLEEANGIAAADRRIRTDARRGGEAPSAARAAPSPICCDCASSRKPVQAYLMAGSSTWGTRARCSRSPAGQQMAAAARVVAQGLSVREDRAARAPVRAPRPAAGAARRARRRPRSRAAAGRARGNARREGDDRARKLAAPASSSSATRASTSSTESSPRLRR